MATDERRQFKRVDFKTQVELSQQEHYWQTELLDISLRGLLLKPGVPEVFDVTQPIVAKVILSNSTTITMDTVIAHQSELHLGLSCIAIDVQSISHLKRLMALNLGDAAEPERELIDLIKRNSYE